MGLRRTEAQQLHPSSGETLPNRRISGLLTALLTLGALVPTGLAAAGSAVADATTIHVNNTSPVCDDSSADSGTAAVPFCTIQPAVDIAQPGQTVAVTGSTGRDYTANVTVTHSGLPGQPITITSTGPTDPMISAAGKTGVTFTLDGVHDVTASHLAFYSSVVVQNSQRVVLDQDSVLGNTALDSTRFLPGIEIQGADTADVQITRSLARLVRSVAVSIGAQVARTTVSGDVFLQNGGGGIAVNGAVDTAVANDTFTLNCHSAVDVTGAATGTTIENSIMSGDNVASVGTIPTYKCPKESGAAYPELSVSNDAAAATTADYNLVDPGNGAPGYAWDDGIYPTTSAFQATGQGAHDIQADPLLRSDHSTLTDPSPAIDSANPEAPGLTSTDYAGNARVDDPLATNPGGSSTSYTDRGAVELQNPLALGAVTTTFSKGPDTAPVTASVAVSNPWGTEGVTYSFDFDDSSAPDLGRTQSKSPTSTHTYFDPSPGTHDIQAWANLPGKSESVTAVPATVTLVSPSPIRLELSELVDGARSSLWRGVGLSDSSAWSIVSETATWGDGTATDTLTGADLATYSIDSPVFQHLYKKPGTYTATVTAVDFSGARTSQTQTFHLGSSLVPVTPVRALDTRSGTGAPKHKVGPGGIVKVKVAGQNGLPTAGITAVTMNVTDADATADSYVTAYADGTTRPTASNLNFKAGQTNPNQVTVPVGTDGYVDLANAYGSVDLIADIQGYYTTAGSPQGGFITVDAGTRVLDTRSGIGAPKQKVGPGGVVTLDIGSRYYGATAVLLNLTATDSDSSSWVGAYPGGTSLRTTSDLNFAAGETTPNLVLVPVGADGTISLYNHTGHVDLIADVQAYLLPNRGMSFFPVTPFRALDTRTGTGGPKGALGARRSVAASVAGTHGVPVSARNLLLNLTATDVTGNTWLGLMVPGDTPPTTSVLNVAAGQTRPNAAVAPGADLGVYNSSGSVDVIADVNGYYMY